MIDDQITMTEGVGGELMGIAHPGPCPFGNWDLVIGRFC